MICFRHDNPEPDWKDVLGLLLMTLAWFAMQAFFSYLISIRGY
jgi:hypothetical protein